MRYAIVSDIHANWPAWCAVRDDLRAQRADVVVCLGDVVGYGPAPRRVLTDVRQCCDHILMGNHEAAAIGQLNLEIFNPNARKAAVWTAQQLNEEDRQFLGQLPLALEDEDLLFVHAEPVAPEEWGYVENPADAATCFQASAKRIIFVGHTHFPEVFTLYPDGRITQTQPAELALETGARYLVNVGSVGEPRDGSALASYGLYDSGAQRLTFRKVSFDLVALRRALQQQPDLAMPWFLQEHAPEAEPLKRERAMRVPKVATTKIRVQAASRAHIQVGRNQVLKSAPAVGPVATPPSPSATKRDAAAAQRRRNTRIAVIFFVCAISLFSIAALVYFLNTADSGTAAATPQPPPTAPVAATAAGAGAQPATPPPAPSGPQPFTLTATQAQLQGQHIKLEQHENLPLYVAFWNQPSDTVTWKLNMGLSARYDVTLVYALAPRAGAYGFELHCGRAILRSRIKDTGSWYEFRSVKIGQINLPYGPCTLEMKSIGAISGGLLNLRELRLQPAGG